MSVARVRARAVHTHGVVSDESGEGSVGAAAAHQRRGACPAALRLSADLVASALDRAIAAHGKPQSITCDHGTEFISRASEDRAYRCGVQLDFTRPGKPTDNSFIESFNGKLRDECLNVHQFVDLADARRRI